MYKTSSPKGLITVAQKFHGNFNLLTAASICSRQFQFAHGSFSLLTAVSISLTAVSICVRQFQFRSWWAYSGFQLTLATPVVKVVGKSTVTSSLAKLKLPWANWNCREQIEIAVSKLKLPWHFWATVWIKNKPKLQAHQRILCYHFWVSAPCIEQLCIHCHCWSNTFFSRGNCERVNCSKS